MSTTPIHKHLVVALLAAAALVAVPQAATLFAAPEAAAEAIFPEPDNVSGSPERAQDPAIAVGPSGAATLVWRDAGSPQRIRARRIDPDGSPESSVRTLREADGEEKLGPPRVAVDPDGRATAVWAVHPGSGGEPTVEGARLTDDGSRDGPLVQLSAAGEAATAPDLAIDPDGRATVVWISTSGEASTASGEETTVRAMRWDAGSLRPLGDLSAPGEMARDPRVGVDGHGRAMVAWVGGEHPHESARLRRITSAGIPVASPEKVSPTGRIGSVDLDLARAGRATLAWRQHSAFEPNIHLRTVDPDGSTGRIRDLTVDRARALEPSVAVDGEGRAIASWLDATGPEPVVRALRTGPKRIFGPVRTLSDPVRTAGGPEVAVDPEGRPSVAWSRESGWADVIELSRAEIEGPETTIVEGPADRSVINEPEPELVLHAEPAGPLGTVTSLECRLSGGDPFDCSLGGRLGPLADGPHQLAVQAVDIEGDRGPATSRSFRVIATGLPSKLTVETARVIGAHPAARWVAIVGSVSTEAAGEPVFLSYRAAGGRIRAATRTNPHGRFRIVQRLRGRASLRPTGRAILAYPGNRRLRAAGRAIRVGPRSVAMRLGRARLEAGRLRLAGRITPRIGGDVRAQIQLNRPDAEPATLRVSAPVNRRGIFRLERPVPAWLGIAGGWVEVTHPGSDSVSGTGWESVSGRVAGVGIEPDPERP